MAQLSVTIAGRSYRMSCADGEEDHLRGLAQMVDEKIADMRQSFGEIGDQRLIVMAALTVADELSGEKRRIEALEDELARRSAAQTDVAAASESWAVSVANALDDAAVRIESDRPGHECGRAGASTSSSQDTEAAALTGFVPHVRNILGRRAEFRGFDSQFLNGFRVRMRNLLLPSCQ